MTEEWLSLRDGKSCLGEPGKSDFDFHLSKINF
jgi:hypothetical protein